MARLGSQQTAGYFPTPAHLLSSFASLLRWPETLEEAQTILDPCAGDGAAVIGLRDAWLRQMPDVRGYAIPRIVACELEAGRAMKLRQHESPRLEAFEGDAFSLVRAASSDQATVLYLNPPYDHDAEYRRLEHRFLTRFTDFLAPGGILLFLVPAQALAASAELLARDYLDLRAYRLPPEDFAAFRQVLVLARRCPQPLAGSSVSELICSWGEDPQQLPVLPQACQDPLDIDGRTPGYLRVHREELDVVRALDEHRPLDEPATGYQVPPAELIGPRFETAVPPRPVHIALALAGGLFNGHELVPNDPAKHPVILAKGTFERQHVEVSRRVNADGELTGTIEVERPRLTVTILSLDTGSFHTLRQGTVPTGSDDPTKWTAADLITYYDQALAALLARQFPALHDPANDDHQIALPKLARKPFRVQATAVQALIKLIGSGENPFLLAEVGTGKSAMALMTAAALSPAWYEQTRSELARVGVSAQSLPLVRRTLIVCPPHLIETWKAEIEAVVPGWRVAVLTRPSDLDRPAEVYLLSRETAKLGPSIQGLSGTCPGCGSPIPHSERTNASRRRRCRARTLRPDNLAARLAVQLASLLAPHAPGDPVVSSLLSPAAGRHYAGRFEGRDPVEGVPDLSSFHRTLLGQLDSIFSDETRALATSGLAELVGALRTTARSLHEADSTRRHLEELLEQTSSWRSPYGPQRHLREAITALSRPAGSETLLKALLDVLRDLHRISSWSRGRRCDEPLFFTAPRPRRTPLARRILRRHRHRFDLLILDEVHEYGRRHSAQAKAAHRLTTLPGVPTLSLTGSLMGGYASSLFPNLWALSRRFRAEFERTQLGAFVDRYGYRKTYVPADTREMPTIQGVTTDRELARKNLGEAPGVLPSLILRHLLPVSVLVHKSDLDCELPPFEEHPVHLSPDPDDEHARELMAAYERGLGKLLARIRVDRFDPERSGRLLGALVELPSYLDLATDDLAPYEIRYPESVGGELIEALPQLPAASRTPKEAWLLERLRHHLANERRVLLFVRHTGQDLPQRLVALISQEVTSKVAWLDAQKVPTHKRERWIDREVVDRGIEVLLVNPEAVKTGLNNLTTFSVGIWYELTYSALTVRQANGRLHRIGQTKPVTVEVPVYAGTGQQMALELVAKKLSASLQVDALDLQTMLEAIGASDDEIDATATALNFGQAIYQALTRSKAA